MFAETVRLLCCICLPAGCIGALRLGPVVYVTIGGKKKKKKKEPWLCMCLIPSNAESHMANAFQGSAKPAMMHQPGAERTSEPDGSETDKICFHSGSVHLPSLPFPSLLSSPYFHPVRSLCLPLPLCRTVLLLPLKWAEGTD